MTRIQEPVEDRKNPVPKRAKRLKRARRSKYNAMVSTAHPLATDIGIDVLERGGNCVDAAIAVAAALNVVDMSNTGIGGDAFALVYFRSEGRVIGLNASGRSPFAANIEEYKKHGWFSMPERGPLSVTTPGALSGWTMLHERWGTMSLEELLRPAIKLARDGFEINNFISFVIAITRRELKRFPKAASIYLKPDGGVPERGDVLRQPELAESLEMVAADGASAMYGGPLGDRICEALGKAGGLLSPRDFTEHRVEWVEPIRTVYRGYEVLTIPPNSQGMTLLQMLNIIEGYDVGPPCPNDPELLHLQIEAKKLAFEDRDSVICDPDFYDIPTADLISKGYAENQRTRIDSQSAFNPEPPSIPGEGDTTYFCVVDKEGNAISFINSLFHSFGSCVVAGDTGILLQNRGLGFSFNPEHPNSLQPHKRPMHTLVPCMVLKDSEPYIVLGCIGGDQQPQGLLQILMNITDFGMPPQAAIDAPRWRSYEGLKMALETAFGPKVVQSLSGKGHAITDEIDFFGGAQCIVFDADKGLIGGSDRRLAGCWRGLL